MLIFRCANKHTKALIYHLPSSKRPDIPKVTLAAAGASSQG
jgi:hypothetical protein